MDMLQGLVQSIQQPTTSPHVGETFHIWTYCVEVSESRALMKLMVNHTNDKELKEMIEHFVDEIVEPQQKRLIELMKNEGITAPEVTADVGKADERLIPPGAKLTDVEVAQMLVVKVVGLLEWSHRGAIHSLRDDIGAMFNSFYNHLLAQGFTLKKLLRKRGWLRVPPHYYSGIIQEQSSQH